MDKMKINETEFKGVYVIENSLFVDNRGEFQKLYQNNIYQKKGLDILIKEHFFSVSKKGVIRGMHFQLPPYAQSKIVYVMTGKVIDVIIDLRKNSDTFKQFMQIELNTQERRAVFIPSGFAHGFQSLEDDTIMIYSQSKEFEAASDFGINPFSFNMRWPIDNYIVSDKDTGLIRLDEFNTPF
jgi:dTDP-4-dehydrorhamnose 3,5-epimerase